MIKQKGKRNLTLSLLSIVTIKSCNITKQFQLCQKRKLQMNFSRSSVAYLVRNLETPYLEWPVGPTPPSQPVTAVLLVVPS